MKKSINILLAVLMLSACERGTKVENQVLPNSETVPCGEQTVRLQVVAPEIVRVSVSPDGIFPDRQSLAVVPQECVASYETAEEGGKFVLRTSALTVEVNKADGTVNFFDAEGEPLALDGRSCFAPIEVEGKKAWSTTVSFASPEDEAFYGLGQHQAGEFNHKGLQEELFQYNTKVSVPMVLSTRGYGLMFDAYSLSRWGTDQPYKQLGEVFDLDLTGTYRGADGQELVQKEDSLFYENEFAIKNLPAIQLNGGKVTYEGTLTAKETGDYHFIQYYAGFQRTEIDGKEQMSRRWRPAWNPNSYKFTVHMEAGKPVPIKLEWEPDGDVSYVGLRVQPFGAVKEDRLTFWSEFEPELDYYFIAGDTFDSVIGGYRELTGRAPIMPKWVLGFWQSRERYSTQDELVETLAELRRRHIPVDNIVQDWYYWKEDQWGSHEFDETRYPNPEKMLDDVHAMHGRFMISVWPKFYTNTDHYKELKAAGYAYTHAEDAGIKDWLNYGQSFYDAYAEGGRKMFWRQIDESLYSRYNKKIDAWWMDASEPNLRDCLPMDYLKWLLTPTALGPSTEYLNAYSIVNADAIYNGQRGVDPDKRVFLLTRSGFLGEQRYSTATWSGDIGTSWTDLRMQMAAGLNFCMSGIPFWGMDIGGFSVMSKFQDPANAEEWQELQTRWHQFGTFVPLFRTHGQWPRRELWNIAPEGSQAYNSILWYMRLRYRLMPYLYSLAHEVYANHYTIMRGLPMDFPQDLKAREISDQWLFGPALMVAPVSEYKARSREVYFPEGDWYDFYTGKLVKGGKSMTVAAPYERIPLYVPAGSILPVGPEIEYVDEKPADEILLLVYAGQNGYFTLYEDDGLTYAYEEGEKCEISMEWDDDFRVLRIGGVNGSVEMGEKERTFRIVVVDPKHPFVWNPDTKAGKVVKYNGDYLEVQL